MVGCESLWISWCLISVRKRVRVIPMPGWIIARWTALAAIAIRIVLGFIGEFDVLLADAK